MKDFKGLYAALLTPFDNKGFNEKSLKKSIDLNIKCGMNGLYVCGSTGEGMLLSEEERIALLTVVKSIAGDRCRLIAHVGTISTDSAIRMAKAAERLGYDAVSAVAPYYYGFSTEAIKRYYTDIIDATDMPFFIYNFPNAGGFNGMLELVESMLDNPKLVGIKHTSQNLFDLHTFKHLKKPLTVLNGFDEMLLGGLALGADGGIGSTYNVIGPYIKGIYDSFLAGKMKEAQAFQDKANKVIRDIIPYGVMPMEKQILTCLGITYGECRKPFLPVSDDGKKLAEKIAADIAPYLSI